MNIVLATKPVCPGIRFKPTDVELFMYFLRRKVRGKSLPQMMSEVDVYQYAPWDLPDKSCLNTKDLYWYFFCPIVKKSPNGTKIHRLNKIGYWKSTGNDRTVQYKGRSVGKIKTLIFHRQKPPHGVRTNWVMHEYRLQDQLLVDEGIPLDSYSICQIYKKSGLGPKNGEDYGAPFVEEDWESDDEANVRMDQEPVVLPENVPDLLPENVAPTHNVNVVNTSAITQPGSVTAAWTPTATEQTVDVESVQNALDDDCFVGLEDLCVNGSNSIAYLNLPQWTADCSTGYLELNDTYSSPLFDWAQPTSLPQPAEDTDGFIELNDLK